MNPADKSKPFSDAIEHGNIAAVEAILQQNPDWVNHPSWTPPPLHCAVLWNQPEVASVLLRHGANIEMLDADRQTTPLRYAIMYCKLDMTPLLIAHGANTGSIVKNGISAVQLAEEAAKGCYEEFADLPRKEQYEQVIQTLRSIVGEDNHHTPERATQ